MNNLNDTDRELLDAFEKCRIPLDRWNQRTHVSIAYLLLNESLFDEALDRLRTGIRRYNESQGIEESATSGYNETTTVSMMRIIESVMNAYAEVFPCDSADEFCDQHPELMSKHILRLFYSPGRRMDPRAKREFLPPDLTDLPRVRTDRDQARPGAE